MNTILAVWAALGPLAGVSLGAYIANRNQRRQWLGNCKREEYRELISALTKCLMTHIGALPVRGPEQQKAEYEAILLSGEVIRSRIFIAPVVKELRVTERWYEATHDRKHNPGGFAAAAGKLIDDIREAAVKDLSD